MIMMPVGGWPRYFSKNGSSSVVGSRRCAMRIRLPKSIGASVVGVSVLVILQPTAMTAQNQAPSVSVKAPAAAPMMRTPWGEPDLQGIWTVEADTPLQRPARYANQEFFTEAQPEELDLARSALLDLVMRRDLA